MLPAHALPVLVWGVEGEADPDDERQQAVVDGDAATKKLAMAAHQTQVTVGEDMTFHYSNGVEQKISGRETYRLLARVPHDDEDPSEREPAGPVSSSVTGLSLGLIVGFIGTLFHASIGYFSGWYLPWGLVLALILVLSATVWTAHVTRRAWATVLPGLSAFILVGFFVYARSDSLLVIPNPSVAIGQVGIAWVLGIVAMTVLGEWIANRHILRTRR